MFPVGSPHKKIANPNKKHNSCEESLKEERDYVLGLMTRYKNGSLDLEKDYKRYRLRPCQQIRRFVKNSLIWHYAIYLFYGIICEMGSGPKPCEKIVHFFGDTSIIGLNTLSQFKKIGDHSDSFFSVHTKHENKQETLQRFKRLLNLMGTWDYNIITNNCKTFCNLVTFNKTAPIMHVDYELEKY